MVTLDEGNLDVAIEPLRQRAAAAIMAATNLTESNYTWAPAWPDDSDDMLGPSPVVRFQYIAWGITGNTISAFGLVGNFLSVIVLANRRMRSSTSSYLIALAVFDSIVLISLVLFLALPIISFATGKIMGYANLFPYMQPYAYPTALTAQTCSIYTTVAFTTERYIAVCWPLKAAKMCTSSRARKAVLFIVACSVVYNIPRMLEYQVVEGWDPAVNATFVRYECTALGAHPTYRHVYLVYMQILFMLVVPFIILAVLNTLLIRAVRHSEHALKGSKVNSSKAKREKSLTVMLISVVIVFLICQVPSIVDNILGATLTEEKLHTAPFVKLTSISSLMVITNSAVNFYLYCVFGRKFRRVFCRIFCRCLPLLLQRHLESETSLLQAPSMRGASSRNGYPSSSLSSHLRTSSSRDSKILSTVLASSGTAATTTTTTTTGGSGGGGTRPPGGGGGNSRLQMSVFENGKTKSVYAASQHCQPYARMDSCKSQTSQL